MRSLLVGEDGFDIVVRASDLEEAGAPLNVLATTFAPTVEFHFLKPDLTVVIRNAFAGNGWARWTVENNFFGQVPADPEAGAWVLQPLLRSGKSYLWLPKLPFTVRAS